MPSKSLKTTFKLPSASLDAAIIYLSERFLRASRGIRIVKSPNEFCLLTLCRPLIDGWFTGQLAYSPGQITLIFHHDVLSAAADIVMYLPQQGDRFLYTKPHLDPPLGPAPEPKPESSTLISLMEQIEQLGQQQRQLHATLTDAVATSPISGEADPHQETLVRALSQAFQSSSRPMLGAITQLTTRIQQLEAAVQSIQADRDDSGPVSNVDQGLAAIEQLSRQQRTLQHQLEQILAQISTHGDSNPPVPQTEGEWRSRIERTRGTVGNYETYSVAYREMNADTPLFDTPDWVMLCEFDWAQRLCPTLADLHKLLYGPEGIGDEGADILQQFGAHSRGTERYYLYRERGYDAETAMREIAYHPEYSWLPTLRRLWQTLKTPSHNIFDLFGWEQEAVTALGAIAEPPRRQAGYADDRGGSRYSYSGQGHGTSETHATGQRSLQDYQALLNIGPFAPLTAETVKRAYRQAMKTAHPDSGGSTQKAQQLNEAYQAVMRHYFPSRS